MAASFVYTSIFTLFLASGAPIEAEEASYPTYDACMLQSEADLKNMAKEWDFEQKRTGLPSFFTRGEVRCVKRPVKKEARHGRG